MGPIPSVIRHTSNPNQCLVYLKGTKSVFPEFPEKRNGPLIDELLLEAKFRPHSPESLSSENQPLSPRNCVCCSEGKFKWYASDRRQYLNLLAYFTRMLRSVNCIPIMYQFDCKKVITTLTGQQLSHRNLPFKRTQVNEDKKYTF